jgi:pimeloyl-ACP methyl ester carboxylesterase
LRKWLAFPTILLAVAIPLPAAADTPPSVPCTSQTVQVSLSPGGVADQQVAAHLCGTVSATNTTLQLAIPGFTYNHSYWDFAYQPEQYSYLRRAAQAGYTTLLFDRLGTGDSSKPPALLLDVPTHAWVVHQLVTKLHAGQIGGTAFPKIVLIGHSLGAATAEVEASTYHDVNAVVASDWLHLPLGLSIPDVLATMAPVHLTTPRFANRPLGYLTTLPGARARNFYQAGDADPQVISIDEATKDTGTENEVITVALTLPATTQGITVPVLLATGENDTLFCGPATPCADAKTLKVREGLFFSHPACLTTYVLPAAGHDINLHRNAPDWFSAATNWINAVATPVANTPSPDCSAVER